MHLMRFKVGVYRAEPVARSNFYPCRHQAGHLIPHAREIRLKVIDFGFTISSVPTLFEEEQLLSVGVVDVVGHDLRK